MFSLVLVPWHQNWAPTLGKGPNTIPKDSSFNVAPSQPTLSRICDSSIRSDPVESLLNG
jgi:hypothetical protein